MEKKYKVFFGLLFIFVFCITIIIFENYQIELKNQNINKWLYEKEKNISYLSNSISGNAKWLIYDLGNSSITITPLNFLSMKQEIDFSVAQDISIKENDTYLPIWAPNNSSFLLVKANRECLTKEFVLFRNIFGRWYVSKNNLYRDKISSAQCNEYKWSIDSKEFAVVEKIDIFEDKLFQPGNIYYIELYDNKANLNQVIDFQISQDEEFLFPNGMNIDFEWFNDSILLTYNNSLISPSKIISFSETDPDNYSEVILLNGVYQIINSNNDSTRLFLSRMDYSENSEYLVVDVVTGEIINIGSIDGSSIARIINPKISTDLDFFGFIIPNYEDNEQNDLLIWDWEDGVFSKYSGVRSILGWDNTAKGFLVILNDDDERENIKLQIITPK